MFPVCSTHAAYACWVCKITSEKKASLIMTELNPVQTLLKTVAHRCGVSRIKHASPCCYTKMMHLYRNQC